jgi:hypothetical protein
MGKLEEDCRCIACLLKSTLMHYTQPKVIFELVFNPKKKKIHEKTFLRVLQ